MHGRNGRILRSTCQNFFLTGHFEGHYLFCSRRSGCVGRDPSLVQLNRTSLLLFPIKQKEKDTLASRYLFSEQWAVVGTILLSTKYSEWRIAHRVRRLSSFSISRASFVSWPRMACISLPQISLFRAASHFYPPSPTTSLASTTYNHA